MRHDEPFVADLDPETRQAWRRALRLVERGRWSEGEAALRALLGQSPAFVPAWNKLGVCRVRQGDREGARDAFRRALELAPDYVPALSNLGTTYLEDGDTDQAISFYQRALALDPEYAVARENLAAAYKRRGDIDAFVRELRRAQRDEFMPWRTGALGGGRRRAPRPTPEDEARQEARRGCLMGGAALALLALCVALGALAGVRALAVLRGGMVGMAG